VILRPNRILFSKSEVYNQIAKDNRIDQSYLNKENYIDLKDIQKELVTIEEGVYPLKKQILTALKKKDLVLTRANSQGSSVMYHCGMDGSKEHINTVFINLSRIVKNKKTVDDNGDISDSVTITGGYVNLYDALFGGIAALNAERLCQSSDIINDAREFYTSSIAQIVSKGFGNPLDGDKFRFIVDVFFMNGTTSPDDIAIKTEFNRNKLNILKNTYPEYFGRNPEGLKITDMIRIINAEFKVFKEPVTLNKLIMAAQSGLEDVGTYVLDNIPYLLAMMAVKTRKGRLFNGYLTKIIERKAAAFSKELIMNAQ